MELSQFSPPELDLTKAAVYLFDADAATVRAGPFSTEHAAISWIAISRQPCPKDQSKQVRRESPMVNTGFEERYITERI
jgi:hypothetical protein